MAEQISSQELWSRVDALAAKLGVAADQLFEATKARVVSEAVVDPAILFGLFLVGLVLFLVSIKRAEWGDGNRWCAPTIVGGAIALGGFAGFVAALRQCLVVLGSPDYAAFQRIVELIK